MIARARGSVKPKSQRWAEPPETWGRSVGVLSGPDRRDPKHGPSTRPASHALPVTKEMNPVQEPEPEGEAISSCSGRSNLKDPQHQSRFVTAARDPPGDCVARGGQRICLCRQTGARTARDEERLSMRVRAASDPVWAARFDPRSGRLDTRKSVKLLLRPFRPGHKNEITPILRLADFEGGTVFQRNHIATLAIAACHANVAQDEAGSRGRKSATASMFR